MIIGVIRVICVLSNSRTRLYLGGIDPRLNETVSGLSAFLPYLHSTKIVCITLKGTLFTWNYLADDANVNIAIYNAIGRRIRIIELGAQRAGSYVLKNKAAYWNGRSDTGELVSSDTYFYYLRAGDFAATKKMIVLK